jgi:hypothetical protein
MKSFLMAFAVLLLGATSVFAQPRPQYLYPYPVFRPVVPVPPVIVPYYGYNPYYNYGYRYPSYNYGYQYNYRYNNYGYQYNYNFYRR